jgi:UrcA family protein
MINVTARIAGLATLALAALPVAALTTAAHAQGVAHQTVQVADLNLATAAGKAAFDRRVEAAARRFCTSERGMDMQASCRAGVRAEANEKAATNVQLATRL